MTEPIQMAELSENIVLTPSFVANSILTLKRYVECRLGLTFTSSNSVVKEVARGELVALRTTNPIFEAAQPRLIVRANRPPTRAARGMLERIEASPLFGGGKRERASLRWRLRASVRPGVPPGARAASCGRATCPSCA
ncbi:LysR family transcriptional regulator [Cupriavidus basilensis OR16]|uniref:LysR family transcriptional regulator n=1 Tax=Cupriavidus basilensis OR16 TaxID=1127483 RepID=H1S111_9BURK|nr:LysR family transcriptional regulator [Cupriavidus basilensis OR16]